MSLRRIGQFASNITCTKAAANEIDTQGRISVSSGIFQQRQLCRIVEHIGWKPTMHRWAVDAYGGWGRKPSGISAERLANKKRKRFFALEDGFLRSVGLGQQGEPPLSIIMDGTGIYYDATTTSDLELRLNSEERAKIVDVDRARAAMDLLQQRRLSKYNQARVTDRGSVITGEYILVIDQTKNDPSISYGLADASSFALMLDAAKYENPGKKIIVKTHPAVSSGQAKGHFSAVDKSVVYLSGNQNPWPLLDGATKVYTVTSGMGMEALIAGKPVRCFGMPYYAGYGLTQDDLPLDRRNKVATLENLFSAAYLEYPVYYDPYADKLCNFEEAVDILSFLREQNDVNRSKTVCLGMSKWKQKSVAAFLGSTNQKPLFIKSKQTAIRIAKSKNARLVVWASKSTQDFESHCEAEGIKLIRMEDGFLRSNGLGSNLIPPTSLVLDHEGIYYDPNRPSDLEALIESGNFSTEVLNLAQEMRAQITSSGLTKYNLPGHHKVENLPDNVNKRIILVPGQVADDASIRLGTKGSKVSSNLDLLAATRAENPDAFILYKPHPDVEAGNRYGRIPPHQVLQYANYIGSDLSTEYALSICDEVWTLTSLMGLEGLLRDKKVVCFGLPFYAGWGLTTDKMRTMRRKRIATLDEVFAAAYLIYPKYVFPGLDGFMRMPPEKAPAVLKRQKN